MVRQKRAADLAAAPQQYTALWGGSRHRIEAGRPRFNAAGGAAGACVQVCGQPEPNVRRAQVFNRQPVCGGKPMLFPLLYKLQNGIWEKKATPESHRLMFFLVSFYFRSPTPNI